MAAAQDSESASTTAQQLESMAEQEDAEPEDDALLQQLDHYKKNPLDINTAGAEELALLNVLNALQIQQFISYRALLGKIIHRYELQAIPTWGIDVIKKLLPYITLPEDAAVAERWPARWNNGDRKLLLRYARVLEKSRGYDQPPSAAASYYMGSRDKVFTRYTYNYKNLLQYGWLADKDAGEPFFKGKQRIGFDFYSIHFFARKLGIIKSLTIGDFTVNFGQGLVQWQSMAFKKNAAVINVKRQSAALRPYTSAGEYNFQRGAGITLQKKNWETTVFASYRKISSNVVPDSTSTDETASSLQAGGYHRTPAENADRNNLQQTAGGVNLQYSGARWRAGVSAVYYHLSTPIQKTDRPYNLFALQGNSFLNTGIDYSYTWHNMHFFGEVAADRQMNKALLNGAVISVHASTDVSLVYRTIDRRYQSVHATAFTENSTPVNEEGLYTGISVRPVNGVQVDAYADVYRFPWLKYRVDAPSAGKDYLLQFNYKPNKQVLVYMRYKSETKMANTTADSMVMSVTAPTTKNNLRLQTSVVVNRQLSLSSRAEMVWYKNAGNTGEGFMTYLEAFYKPAVLPCKGNMRLQYFETDGFNERLYAYESDLTNSFSIPFFYDKGLRYYFNISWDAAKFFMPVLRSSVKKRKAALDIAMKWAQTIYDGRSVIGSGLDEINGNKHTEIKLQLILKY